MADTSIRRADKALTAVFVKGNLGPGKYHDGGGLGLYLRVEPNALVARSGGTGRHGGAGSRNRKDPRRHSSGHPGYRAPSPESPLLLDHRTDQRPGAREDQGQSRADRRKPDEARFALLGKTIPQIVF